MNWQTITPIDEYTYRISEPLGVVEPRFELEVVNMYLVIGRERAALIDSGMGIGQLAAEVGRLTSLPCQVLCTHSHWDHVGANAQFEQIAIHPLEQAALLEEPDMDPYRPRLSRSAAQGLLPAGFDAESYRILPRPATDLLDDGQEIDLGGRVLRAIHTPGHSRGHMAFLDEAAGQLFSGDVAYMGGMFACFEDSDPEAFYNSIQRLAGIEGLRLLCPGHEELVVEAGWLSRLAGYLETALSGQRPGEWGDFISGRRFDFEGCALWLPGE